MSRSTAAATDHTDRREAILAAALSLFAARTYGGTPVPLVADTAGVAAGTIYRYFPSKDALVNALYRRWKGEMRRVTVLSVTSGATAREQFGEIWGGLWGLAAAHPQAIAFLETHHHGAYLDAESLALDTRFEAETRAIILAAQESGAMRAAHPGVVMALVMGAFTGLIKRAGAVGLRAGDALATETEEIMWSALKR